MADAEANPDPVPSAPTGTGGGKGAVETGGIEIIKTPTGILMIINIFLTLICWATMADVMGGSSGGRGGFLIFTTIVPWLVFIAVLILIILKLTARLSQIPWSLALMIFCAVFAALTLISASLVAETVSGSSWVCGYYSSLVGNWCDRARASVAFGFFSMIGMAIQAFFHFREWRA